MQLALFDTDLSADAKSVLIVLGRDRWTAAELRHDVVWSTRGQKWEVKGEAVQAAVDELVAAGAVTIDGDTLRRIPNASD